MSEYPHYIRAYEASAAAASASDAVQNNAARALRTAAASTLAAADAEGAPIAMIAASAANKAALKAAFCISRNARVDVAKTDAAAAVEAMETCRLAINKSFVSASAAGVRGMVNVIDAAKRNHDAVVAMEKHMGCIPAMYQEINEWGGLDDEAATAVAEAAEAAEAANAAAAVVGMRRTTLTFFQVLGDGV